MERFAEHLSGAIGGEVVIIDIEQAGTIVDLADGLAEERGDGDEVDAFALGDFRDDRIGFGVARFDLGQARRIWGSQAELGAA